ncbi:MAG: apolipoprotein N-acyltransferase [Phycisphaerales bacterium]|jgi:apolipoprotein N-acyltransferase
MPKSQSPDKPTKDSGRDTAAGDAASIDRRGPMKPWLRAFLLGLASAALLAMCNAPVNLWWVGFVAPLPLICLAVRPGMAPSRAGFWAAIGASPWWAFSHFWAASVSTAGVVPLVIYLAMWTMLFVWIGGRVAKRWPTLTVLTLPIIWVGLEFLRGSLLFSGYAWFLAGHPMIDSPGSGLAYPASFGGAYFVSWLVLLGACGGAGLRAPATTILSRNLATAALAIWVVWLGLGLTVLARSAIGSGPTLTVSVVQSNVPQSNKMGWTPTQRYIDWLDLRELTLQAASAQPDVIVWPETMFPGYTLGADSLEAEYQAGLGWAIDREADPRLDSLGDMIGTTDIAFEFLGMQRELGIPMLVGATGFNGLEIVERPSGGFGYDWAGQFNSVFLLKGGRVTEPRYDKIRLMAFGETMPYVWRWPWLQQKLLDLGAEGMSFTLSRGRARTVFDVPLGKYARGRSAARVVTPICFEATMPDLCRSLVYQNGKRRADVMVNPSNDGWFGSSVGMREHYLRTARWRCVELATPMIRACNTGISAVIDADGTIIADSLTTPPGGRALEAGILTSFVFLPQRETLYGRTGDVFGGSTAILTAMIVGWGVIGRRKKTGATQVPGPGSPTDSED